jgi:cell division septal protein FtsQ
VKFRRRRSLLPRLPRRISEEEAEPLKGQVWTRSEKALKEPDVHWLRKAVAVTVAVLEIGLLGWLWFGPAMAIRTVQVYGAQHLTAAQVAAIAGLDQGASVFAVDGDQDSRKLLGMTWIRQASVQPDLFGTVTVTISEWQPVAAYHAGASANLFMLSNEAVVLGPTSSTAGLVSVQGPAGDDPKVGQRPLDPQLLTALVNIQRGLPGLIGQQVGSFIFDSCGNLTLISKRGWKAYFGRVLTPEEFETLAVKVAALKAIAGNGHVNYNSADLMYVNVMNAAEPAVGYRSLVPVPPSPSPGAKPTPLASPSPSPAPQCK